MAHRTASGARARNGRGPVQMSEVQERVAQLLETLVELPERKALTICIGLAHAGVAHDRPHQAVADVEVAKRIFDQVAEAVEDLAAVLNAKPVRVATPPF